jgi:dihydroneopterin aldolase
VDEIRLEGLVFFGYHGVNPEETSLGQRFQVDLSVWLDLTRATRSDDLADTVSYAALYKLAKAEVEGQPSKLIEHLAGRILDKILQVDTRINKARVVVTKLNPPLKGSSQGSAAVVLERSREP